MTTRGALEAIALRRRRRHAPCSGASKGADHNVTTAILVSPLLCTLVLSLATPPPALAEEGIARIAVRDGAFVDSESGAPFTPLGVNYFRVAEVDGGKPVHAAFCPGAYDPDFIEKMMADVAGWGFNTVRTFHSYHVGPSGILVSPQAREVEPGYLANVIDFLQRARAHGLRVIFSWDIWLPPSDWWAGRELPGEPAADLLDEWDPDQGINGYRLHRGSVRTRANAIVALIEALRRQDPGLLPVVLAWELENEVYMSASRAPLSGRTGHHAFAGRTYDMASDDDVQALMDAVLVQWANLCSDAIHQADPQALVSTGLFSFAAVGRGGPGTLSRDAASDERIPGRLLALLESRLDYVDMHLYAWRSAEEGVTSHLERNLASVEWPAVRTRARELGKPLLCGECGVFANYLRRAPDWQFIDHELGVQCFREHAEGLANQGLAGALYWAYGNPDSTAGDENPALSFHPQYGRTLREVWAPRL